MRKKFNTLTKYESLQTNFNALTDKLKFEAYDIGILNQPGSKTLFYTGKKTCCNTFYFLIDDLQKLNSCKCVMLRNKKITYGRPVEMFYGLSHHILLRVICNTCQEPNIESAERLNKVCKICKEDGALAKIYEGELNCNSTSVQFHNSTRTFFVFILLHNLYVLQEHSPFDEFSTAMI